MVMEDEYILTHQQHTKPDDIFIEASFSRKYIQLIPLEKFSIPRFNGDVKEYTDFRNSFDIELQTYMTTQLFDQS